MLAKRNFLHQRGILAQTLAIFSMPAWFFSRRFRVVLFVLTAVFTVAYVMALSRASVTGYQIRALEKQLSTLNREQSQLEVELIEKSSLTTIRARMDNLSLVPARHVVYLDKNDGVVPRSRR